MSTELREEDMHYLGGLIDGDGGIHTGVYSNHNFSMGYHPKHSLKVFQGVPDFSAEVDVVYEGEYDMHYIAGLIDSDGSIKVGVYPSEGHRICYDKKEEIAVKMVDQKRENPAEDAVEQFFKSTGSDTKRSVIEGDGENHQDAWERKVNGSDAIKGLKMIRPYLRLKQLHADYVIEMAEYDTTTIEGLLKYAHAVDGYCSLKACHSKERNHNYEKLVDELWYNGTSAATGEQVEAEPPKSDLPEKYGVDGDGEPDPPEIEETEEKTVNSAADW